MATDGSVKRGESHGERKMETLAEKKWRTKLRELLPYALQSALFCGALGGWGLGVGGGAQGRAFYVYQITTIELSTTGGMTRGLRAGGMRA